MSRARLVLAALLAAASCRVPGAAVGAADPGRRGRELLARHLRWRGSVAALGVVALEGDVLAHGQPAREKLVAAPGGTFRDVLDLGGTVLTRVSGPDGGFVVSLSGAVEPLARDERLAMERRLARLLGRGLDPGGVARYLGARERDGRRWDVVRIEYGRDAAVELYLGPQGGLTWARVHDDTEDGWERLGDWTMSGGARVPRLEESFDGAGRLISRVSWRRVAAGQRADPRAFARPAGRAVPVTFPGGAAATGWMPFELRHHKIVMRGHIQDRDAVFLLDTGAGITVLDARMAQRLALPRVGSVTLAGTGARQQAPLVGPFAVDIGGVVIGGLTAVAIDLGVVDDAGPAPPVILGKELFHSVVVDVDFPRRRIAFHDPARFQPRGPGAVVPLVPRENGLVAVEVAVESHPPALFELDTGGAGTLDIFSGYARDTGLLRGRRTSTRRAAGIGGRYQERVAVVARVTLAGQTFHDVPVAFPEVKTGAFHTRRLAGNLGAELLSRFRIVLDFPHGVAIMQPGADALTRPFRKDRSGLDLEPRDGALAVVFVAPGSPAQAAGFRAGDRIVAIDGAPAAGMDDDALRAWGSRPAGTRARLRDATGRTRALVFADYF